MPKIRQGNFVLSYSFVLYFYTTNAFKNKGRKTERKKERKKEKKKERVSGLGKEEKYI